MPEYLYRCGACASTKSVFRHIHMDSDSIAPTCDTCTIPMQRDWSIAGVIFKGDGWGGK